MTLIWLLLAVTLVLTLKQYGPDIPLTAHDSFISHYILLSLGVLTGCILLASCVALIISRYLHNGIIQALQNITDVVYDVRTHRNFSRRVADERIEEFHHFAQDFNGLMDEMKAVVREVVPLSGKALQRAEAVERGFAAPDASDEQTLRAEFHEMMAVA